MPSTWGQRQQYGEFTIVGAAEGRPRLLGEGSFGKTYEAARTESVVGSVIEIRVALKVLNPELLNSASKRVQFVQEHTALTRLRHANLVHCIKCGEDSDEVYFAMELCMGGDLAGLVKRFGALPERLVALIGLQAAAGLRHMHREKMIHRDIKPQNIMLFEALSPACTPDDLTALLEENDSLCRIVDFGLVGTILSEAESAGPAVTRKFVGSMMYASPEQIRCKDIDGRTDIYALGMTLWYLVQGRGPLLDARGDELQHATEAEGRHLASTEHEPDLPHNLSPEFRGILARMVAKSPNERMPNAKELAAALERYLERTARSRSAALTPVQSREGLHAFFNFKEDTLKSIGRQRFAAEKRADKQIVRLTIVEDLDEIEKIRPDFNDVQKKVFALAHMLRQPSVPPTLLPVQDVVWAKDALAYAEDMPGDVTLAEVLQARTASKRPFSFREAEVIFRPIAQALDYLINQGWDFISLPCEEVWLSDLAVAAAPDDKNVLCRSLDEWSELRVTFSGMWVPPQKRSETNAEMSFASTADGGSSIVTADSLRPPVSAFLRLVYRTLSGSDVPDAADRWQNGYIASVSLQTASNNLIRDLLCKQREWSAVGLILNELCANEGVSVDAPVIPSSKRSSDRSRSGTSRTAAGSVAGTTSLGSVGASKSGTRSAASSAYQPPVQQEPPPLPPQPPPSPQSSRVSDNVGATAASPYSSSTSNSGKFIGFIAVIAVVVIAAAAFVFYPRKPAPVVSRVDSPPPVVPEPRPLQPTPPKPEPKPEPKPVPPPAPAPALSVPDGYPTIEAALAAAKPGETVRIKPGVYEEQIRLPDGVSLAAEESHRVTISINGKVGSVLEADGCKTGSTIKGIVFSHSGSDTPSSDAAPVVSVSASKVTFDDCVFEKGLGPGLLVSAAARVSLTKCESKRNQADGFVIKNATAEFNESLAEGNQRHGVSAFGSGCNVKTTLTVAKRNGGTGFMSEEGARISAMTTDSVQNVENGVGVYGADSEAVWQQGNIKDNGVTIAGGNARDSGKGGLGVTVDESGGIFSATGTTVSGNWKHGVVMQTSKSGCVLVNCVVGENQRSGIIISGSAGTALLIEGGEITGNQLGGLTVSGRAFQPVIKRVQISGNGSGVSVLDGAEPQLEGCTIEKNGPQDIDRTEAGRGMTVK